MTALDLSPTEHPEMSRSEILAEHLQRAATILKAHNSARLTELLSLRRRLREERLQVAILGQFKRGKSTFINALLGASVLPTAVVPLTAIATFIAWREDPLIRVHYRHGKSAEKFAARDADDARDILFRFVTEEANANNWLDVARVELFYPAPILSNGMTLIDTPGIGSTLSHNTRAAIAVLPECDAAIFVVSADPPITQAECEYLERVKQRTRQVFFVLNKIDYLSFDDQQRAVDFLRDVLTERLLGDSSTEVFCTSAKRGIDAKLSQSHEEFAASGMALIEDHLVHSLARDKSRILEDSIQQRAAEILSDVRAKAELRLRALQLPLEDLASKLSLFEEKLRAIEEQRRRLGDLLDGDHRRLREDLEARVAALRKEASARLAAIIDKIIEKNTGDAWEEALQEVLSREIGAVFEASRMQLVRNFSAGTTDALLVHLRAIDSLVEAIRQSASGIFEVAFEPVRTDGALQVTREPYWVTRETPMTLIPDPRRLIDRVLPRTLAMARRRARILHVADELVLRNAENLRWAIVCGLNDTWTLAVTQLSERLKQAIDATKGVIEEALAQRKNHSFTIASEAGKLERFIQSLADMRKSLLEASDEKSERCGANE